MNIFLDATEEDNYEPDGSEEEYTYTPKSSGTMMLVAYQAKRNNPTAHAELLVSLGEEYYWESKSGYFILSDMIDSKKEDGIYVVNCKYFRNTEDVYYGSEYYTLEPTEVRKINDVESEYICENSDFSAIRFAWIEQLYSDVICIHCKSLPDKHDGYKLNCVFNKK